MSTNEQTGGPLPPGAAYYDDEISLTDLIMVLWRNRLTVIVVAAVVVVGAVAYALAAKPVYKATTYILPPLPQSIEELNKAQRLGLSGYTTDRVFDAFLTNSRAQQLRRRFFDENNLLDFFAGKGQQADPARVFDKAFNAGLVVKEPEKGQTGPVSISLMLADAEKSAEWLNEFVVAAQKETVTQLIENVTADIRSKTDQLETTIGSRRTVARQRREDQIVKLQEALGVARRLGIEKPSDYNFDAARDQLDAVSVNTDSMPLYARGTMALEAEIAALQERKNDEPFIEGLRDLQEELAALNAIKLDPDEIEVARVDRPAIVPSQREKPNRKLIVVFGGLLGGFLGVLAAFLVEFIKNFRRELSADQG